MYVNLGLSKRTDFQGHDDQKDIQKNAWSVVLRRVQYSFLSDLELLKKKDGLSRQCSFGSFYFWIEAVTP